jgi:hypothetical protein
MYLNIGDGVVLRHLHAKPLDSTRNTEAGRTGIVNTLYSCVQVMGLVVAVETVYVEFVPFNVYRIGAV